MPTVFIDGETGTTGLEISQRLQHRQDLELLQIEPALRKNTNRRSELINQADLVILCLPDAAARATIDLVRNPATRVLDASTAHRTSRGWQYGLPELEPAQRQRIREARWVANPGCYPTGFILSVRPLVDAGVLAADLPLSMHAISGYSGGGRQLIDRYQGNPAAIESGEWSVRPYALSLEHKHLTEMQVYSRIERAPLFSPFVGAFYRGMLTHIPLFHRQLSGVGSPQALQHILAERYADEPCIRVHAIDASGASAQLQDGFLSAQARNQDNGVDLMVFGNREQSLVVARYDNLGKGASGGAVQNLNLMLDLPELSGLTAFIAPRQS